MIKKMIQKKTIITICLRLMAFSVTCLAGSSYAAVSSITQINGSFDVLNSATVTGSFTPETNLFANGIKTGTRLGRIILTVNGGPVSTSTHSALRWAANTDRNCKQMLMSNERKESLWVRLVIEGYNTKCDVPGNWLVGNDTSTSRTTEYIFESDTDREVVPGTYPINLEAAIYIE